MRIGCKYSNERVDTDHEAIILTLEMTAQKNDDNKDPTSNKRWNINSEMSVKQCKESTGNILKS